ncbi:MAG: hypothetical protein IPH97_04510 [Ignavibacteriales bacterium]|nr:hypothetical protein [Ignavibacteriales bacterium]
MKYFICIFVILVNLIGCNTNSSNFGFEENEVSKISIKSFEDYGNKTWELNKSQERILINNILNAYKKPGLLKVYIKYRIIVRLKVNKEITFDSNDTIFYSEASKSHYGFKRNFSLNNLLNE